MNVESNPEALNEEPEALNEEPEENESNPIPKFYKAVTDTLKTYPAEMQEYITAQAMHETGVFTSPLFLKYNNPFGMKQPTQRQTTSQGPTPTGYASYKNIEDGILDLALYFEAKQYPETFESPEAYVDFLKSKGYFEAPLASYKKAVVKHLNNLKPYAQ